MQVIGPTGSGKTTLLKNMVIQDMENGEGLGVIDPKGDLVPEILKFVPWNRVKDVIYFDPTDPEWPLGFNPLEAVPKIYRTRVASEMVTTFKKLFYDSWGPRLEHVLRSCVLALLEFPAATLIDIPELLIDEGFRRKVLEYVTNFAVLDFWETEYKQIVKSRIALEAIEPILNKVGPWLQYPEVRNIVGQVTSSFNLREVMDRGKILLVNIPQGGSLGEDTSSMLGAMLVSKIQLAAMSRADLPAERRVPFYLYVDEFQNFFTSAFEKILAEARSFRMGLVVANQYEKQLSEELQNALFYNVAIRLTCGVENKRLTLTYHELQDSAAVPTACIPLPPPTGGNPDQAKQVKYLSRQRYGRKRSDVEAAIMSRRKRKDVGSTTDYEKA